MQSGKLSTGLQIIIVTCPCVRHDDMWGDNGSIAPLIHNLGTTWR